MGHRQYRGDSSDETQKTTFLDSQLIKRLFQYLRPYRFLLISGILILIVAKALEAYIPIYIGNVTQQILVIPDDLSPILRQCLQIMGLLFVVYLLDGINVLLKSWVGHKALFKLRTDVYRQIQSMPVSYYDTRSVGKMMTRTIHDVDQINQMFAESIIPLIGSIVLFISVYIGIFFVDWRLGLVMTAVLPMVFWLTNHFRIHQRRCYDHIRTVVATMNAFVQEHLMGASTIRSFGLQEQEKARFEKINQDHRNAYLETIHYFAFFFAGIDFVQSISLIAVFVVLVSFPTGEMGFQAGTFFTFSLYALMLFRPLSDLADRYNVLQSAVSAASRIFHLLDQEPEKNIAGADKKLDEIHSIEFDDVWFAYKDEEWILKGLSFQIAKGESLALVGVTGAGKTTVMNLLLRYYDYQKGIIRINGVDIHKYPIHEIRKHFSMVLQDPEIFSGTIAENIGLYQPGITEGKIETVVDYVNLRSLVQRYPDGIQHLISERGKSLSAGERQLLSMARAVAHHRSVLMLDEATANIDTGTERMIQEALHKILKDKTAVVIAHRLSTIQDVSRILVLHNGVVSETGTHQELLRKKGIYEKLYRLQFLNG